MVSLPVLNGLSSEGDAGMTRSLVNTFLSSGSACVASCAVALGVAHVRERPLRAGPTLEGAVVSGGVAVGAVATLMLQPFGAAAIGIVAGALSMGVKMALEDKFGRYRSLCEHG